MMDINDNPTQITDPGPSNVPGPQGSETHYDGEDNKDDGMENGDTDSLTETDTSLKLPFMSLYRIVYDNKFGDFEAAVMKAKDKIKQVILEVNGRTTLENEYEHVAPANCEEGGTIYTVYRQQQAEKQDPILKVFNCDENMGGANAHIIFCLFIKIIGPSLVSCIYALSSKHAWQGIQRYSDFDFPLDIANKILDPKGAKCYVERTPPLGNASGQDTTTRDPVALNKLDKLVVVESFGSNITKAIVVGNSKLLPKGVWVDIGPRRIKFHNRFSLQNISQLLPYLEHLYTETEAESKAFTPRMEKVDVHEALELDKKLAAAVIGSVCGNRKYDWVTKLIIGHAHFKDFAKSTKTLFFARMNRLTKPLSISPKIEEILSLIRSRVDESTKSRKDWKTTNDPIKMLATVTVGFHKLGKYQRKPVLDFFEGHTYVGGKYYCRMSKNWYFICEDLVIDIEKTFRRVISDHILPDNHELYLRKKWPIENEKLWAEDEYNLLYLQEANFKVGDKKTPLGIELCDLLSDLGSDTALYHVKKEFNQTTRDLCSQIQNSASMLQGLGINQVGDYDILRNKQLPQYAQQLNIDVNELMELLGCSQTSPRQVTFVMAVQTHKNLDTYPNGPINKYFFGKTKSLETRSLKGESEKTFVFKKSDLEVGLLQNQGVRDIFKNLVTTGLTGLDSLVYLLLQQEFCTEKRDRDEVTICYQITAKLLYVESKYDFIDFVKSDINIKDQESTCERIRLLLSPWITNFSSMLPKYAVIGLHEYFVSKWSWGSDSFKICEIPGIRIPSVPNDPAKKKKKNNNKKPPPTQKKRKLIQQGKVSRKRVSKT